MSTKVSSSGETLSPESARAIRRVLGQILRKTPLVNAEVALIADLLDGAPPPPPPAAASSDALPAAAGTHVPGPTSADPAHTVAPPPPPARSSTPAIPKTYEVRPADGPGSPERLMEYRQNSRVPFAVPRPFYDAFAAATAE